MPFKVLNLDFKKILWIYHKLEGIIKNIVENHYFDVNLLDFKQILDDYLFHVTYLHTTRTIF